MDAKAGLLAIDIDGTLITDHGIITETVYDALEIAVSEGWEVALASGRTFPAAIPVARRLPFVKYAVLSNGACIIDVLTDDVVHMEKLDSGLVAAAVNIIREKGAIPALYSSDLHNQKVFYDTLDGACDHFAHYIDHDSRTVKVDDVLNYTDNILQIGLIAAKDIIFSIKEALTHHDTTVMTLPFESPSIGGKNFEYWFIQVVARNARKHISVRKLADILNVPQGRLVAVGDNYNDAEMISSADIGISMGNAPDEIKALADVVVGTNNNSGLAEVVHDIIMSETFFV